MHYSYYFYFWNTELRLGQLLSTKNSAIKRGRWWWWELIIYRSHRRKKSKRDSEPKSQRSIWCLVIQIWKYEISEKGSQLLQHFSQSAQVLSPTLYILIIRVWTFFVPGLPLSLEIVLYVTTVEEFSCRFSLVIRAGIFQLSYQLCTEAMV